MQGAVAAFTVGYFLGFTRMVGEIICKVSAPEPGGFADVVFLQVSTS